MNKYHKEIEELERAFEYGDFEVVKKLLPPLLEENIPSAVRINASFFDEGTSEVKCDQVFVEGMFKAAKLGDIKAKYQVGIFYDLGEYGVEQNKKKASIIFKELADAGDPHCMWIYACELIWGNGYFSKSEKEGLQLLIRASIAGSANACMTIADFHNEGKFGFTKSIDERDKYRKMALRYDDTTYDPYA